MILLGLALAQSFESALDLILLESLFLHEPLLELFLIGLLPDDALLQFFLITVYLRGNEEITRLLEQEIVGHDELLLFGWVIVRRIDDLFHDGLDRAVLFDQLEGRHGAHAANRVRVIASTQDAKINKLSLSHLKVGEHSCKLNLADRLLFRVETAQQEVRAERERIHILSGRAKGESHLDELSALSFGFARCLNHGYTEQLNQSLGVLHHFVGHADGATGHLLGALPITRFLGLLFLLDSILLLFLALVELFGLEFWRLAIEDPNRLDSVLEELDGPMEDANQVTRQVSLFVTQLTDSRLTSRKRLRGDQELVDSHGRIDSHGLASEHLELQRLDGFWRLVLDQGHELLDSHLAVTRFEN